MSRFRRSRPRPFPPEAAISGTNVEFTDGVSVRIDQSTDDDFDDPLGLLADCHRRLEYFLDQLLRITRVTSGRSLGPEEWRQLQRALHYFETSEPWHTAD